MQDSIQELCQRREQILAEMGAMKTMRRGSLSRQFLRSSVAGSKDLNGPYYVLQGYSNGRKFSHRVPPEEADAMQSLVDNYKRFQLLIEEFVTITDQLTQKRTGNPLDSSP